MVAVVSYLLCNVWLLLLIELYLIVAIMHTGEQ